MTFASTTAAVFGSIPSPSSNAIEIGPLRLNAYGLMIALGVLAAVWLAGRRLEARGAGTREDIAAIALWAVPAGVIGARLYHVITDWHRFDDAPLDAFKIWEGGLGIPGGMALGVAVGVWVGHRRGVPLDAGLAAVVPALPLAQAIGRWGNWWNQELFGRPTDLPWALEVSPEKAIEAGYPPGTTFHPTFLYESLWNLGLCGVLIWIDKRFSPRGWQLLAMYVMGYSFGRFWIERLRIDEATEIGGWRVNEVVSLALFVAATSALVIGTKFQHRRAAVAVPAGAPAIEVDGVEDDSSSEDDGDPAVDDGDWVVEDDGSIADERLDVRSNADESMPIDPRDGGATDDELLAEAASGEAIEDSVAGVEMGDDGTSAETSADATGDDERRTHEHEV
jgi:prolipoprotein diacylglyceryl transferase